MKIMGQVFSRREWMQLLTVGSAGILGSSCSTIDELMLGPADDMENRMAIVGGGLSAVTFAREIHRKKIPFRIFEQGTRLGGRIWTLRQLTAQGHWAELGGELFGTHEMNWKAWLKNLRLDMQDTFEEATLKIVQKKTWQSEKIFAQTELRRLQRAAQNQLGTQWSLGFNADARKVWENSLGLQINQSLSEWGAQLSKDSLWQRSLEAWALQKFGVSAQTISAAAFLRYFLFAPPSEVSWLDQRYRVDRGNEQIVQALIDHFLGAVPRNRVRLQHSLKKIEKINSQFHLFFQSPEGRRRVICDRVVLSIPLSQFQFVEGLESLVHFEKESVPWSGAHRTVITTPDRYWSRVWGESSLWGEISAHESPPALSDFALRKESVLTLTSPTGRGTEDLKEWQRKWLSLMNEDSLNIKDERHFNWNERTGFQGRGTFLDTKNRPLVESRDRNLILIGEHTSHWNRGTMAGAIESALRASEPFLA